MATPEDANEITALLAASWAATYGAVLSDEDLQCVAREWHNPNLICRQIVNPEIAFLLARDDAGTMVGLVTVRANANRGVLTVLRLYVLPHCQRRGIGTRLLDSVLSRFPDAHAVRLEVAAANANGADFWRRRGFRESGRTSERIGTVNLAVLTMERSVAV